MKNFTKRILFAVILMTVISFALKAQTNVSGGIYSDVTWTKANSPYILTDTVVVFPGVTLTIEAGVTVKFANNKFLEVRQGYLIMIGTITDSITLTSNSSNPVKGIWTGIYLNQSTPAILSYCNFIYSDVGINGNVGTSISVHNSTFTNNSKGLDRPQGSFDSCIFKSNTYGISLSGGTISNSIFSNNGTGLSGANNGVEVTNCTITSNSIGMQGSELHITNSSIDSNSVTGISLGYGSVSKCQIKHNGIGISCNIYNSIIENVIENNNIGIQLRSSGSGQIHCNKICNNILYDFDYKVSFGGNGNISDNYWCSTDSTTIASHIHDGYDNINLGLVSFMPIDTTSCYLTGCNLHINTTMVPATCDTCHNGSASAHVANNTGTIAYTWQTSPIQTTQTATGLASRTYTVCVTDANGCTACTSVFVDSSNCTGFSVKAHSSNASCVGCADGVAWATVTKGSSPYSYLWMPMGATTQTDNNLTAGFYQVCATDLYGCVACDTVSVGIGDCSANFDLYPDNTTPHHYFAVNRAHGSGTISYDWNWADGSSHGSGATPSHTYGAAGFYNICLTITDGGGCTDTYCHSFYLLRTTNTMISVDVVPNLPTGIHESSGNIYIYIFPNPASDHLTLVLPENVSNGTIKIYDLLGKLQYTSAIVKQETNMDVSMLAKGIYLLEVFYGDTVKRQKFIKK